MMGPHRITIQLSGLTGPTPAGPVTLSITGSTFQIDDNNIDFGVCGGAGFSALGIGSTQISFTPDADAAQLGGTLTVYAVVDSDGEAELFLDGATGNPVANWTKADGTHASGTFNNSQLPLVGFNQQGG